MEIFFNELSLKKASKEAEAKKWIVSLIRLSTLIRKILKSLNHQFTLRTRDEFQSFEIIDNYTLKDFVFKIYRQQDPELITFFTILDNPHIEEDDPKRENYEYHSIKLEGIEEENTMSGLGATYIKKDSMAISFDNEEVWNNCKIDFEVTFLDNEGEYHKENASIRHTSKKEHIIKCHLQYFANLFDKETYKPSFDADKEEQNILPLLEIYSFYLGEEEDVWDKFYKEISQLSETERIARIKDIAQQIAEIQGWEKTTSGLKEKNENRTLYTIPNSDFIISVDTQHGDFEVLKHHKRPNHYGSVSFDGKRFKPAENDHSINI